MAQINNPIHKILFLPSILINGPTKKPVKVNREPRENIVPIASADKPIKS